MKLQLFENQKWYRAIYAFLIYVSLLSAGSTVGDAPYLTGVVADRGSQSIEMPGLPFAWQRQIEWLAPEGSFVEVGDPVIRIAPGNLIEQEEILASQYEEEVATVALQRAQDTLAIIDAETALAQAQTDVVLAKLDAEIPATAITQLNFDKAQLAYEDAINRLNRAEVALESAKRKKVEQVPILETRISNAEAELSRVRNAIEQLEMLATQSGIVIYGENELNFLKVGVGDAIVPGQTVATISNQEELQFVFWVHDVDVRHLKYDQRIVVTADAIPDQTIDANVTFLSNHAMEREEWGQGGYYKVIATPLTTPPSEFLPGMAVSAELP